MQAFTLGRAASPDAASSAAQAGGTFIAGGTDLLQLMKLGAERPRRLVDLDGLALRGVSVRGGTLHLGALATMADVASDPAVRQSWPAISQALLSAASPQVRNMGTVGGNMLQRTRCLYFRGDVGPCNKRSPGSGCPAIEGENRDLGILGTGAHCIATQPSDMPVALAALDASVVLRAQGGAERRVAVTSFYRPPGDTPQVETVLLPGEIIVAVEVPASDVAARSRYTKLRDRASFQFATVSVAAALVVAGGRVQDARLAFGGVAPMPWRATAVEQALRGQSADAATFRRVTAAVAAGARPASQNHFKAVLMPRLAARALTELSA